MYKVVIKNKEIIGTPRQDFISDEDVIAGLEGVTASDIQLVEDEPFYNNATGKFELYNKEKIEQQKAQEEAERIKELSMTRSDFFDATIKAFGADQNDFLPIIENILSQIPDTFQIMEDVSNEVAIKIALNNYINAQNFYRKHPLFTILTDVPIQISELLTITITSKQWDEFFDETSKNNKDAYKKLISNTEEKINE